MSSCETVDRSDASYQDLIRVESIPPLQPTASTLLSLAADPDVEVEDLAQVIERDPPLTARLIGIANSAFYAPRQPVTTVKSAIVNVLGLNMVRNVAFGMALTGGLDTRACPRFDLTQYWVMALGTADMASGLARASSLPGGVDPDATYLTGLLHNLGELLLVHLWPTEMNEALGRLEHEPDTPLVDQELELLGIDHWSAGAFLARHWQLPGFVAENIARLGDVEDAPPGPTTLDLVRAARLWVCAVAMGREDPLRVHGVDDAYCEYRSTSFLDRYAALRQLAQTIA